MISRKMHVGNNNVGNTSTRFFANLETLASIISVNSIGMEKLAVVLEVISGYHEINIENFFCLDTVKLYVELYP